MTALTPDKKQKLNRLIALIFASVLLLLVYGPMAPWFVAADRVLYDNLAAHVPAKPLGNAYIVSIDPAEVGEENLLKTYGQVMSVLSGTELQRIILSEPPELAADENLPGWSVAMSSQKRVYVPTRHRFADLATRDGFLQFEPDPDGVLRHVSLWLLHNGVMSPSLPLAVAFGRHRRTIGIDLNEAKLAHYRAGHDPSGEVSGEQLAAATHLEFTSDAAALADAAIVVVVVPTPIDDAHRPDLSPLEGATRAVARHLSEGAIVVFESTVYPGCTEEVCLHPSRWIWTCSCPARMFLPSRCTTPPRGRPT